jgi:hypothetical protein
MDEITKKYGFTFENDIEESKIIKLFNYDIIDEKEMKNHVYLYYLGLYHLLKLKNFIECEKYIDESNDLSDIKFSRKIYHCDEWFGKYYSCIRNYEEIRKQQILSEFKRINELNDGEISWFCLKKCIEVCKINYFAHVLGIKKTKLVDEYCFKLRKYYKQKKTSWIVLKIHYRSSDKEDHIGELIKDCRKSSLINKFRRDHNLFEHIPDVYILFKEDFIVGYEIKCEKVYSCINTALCHPTCVISHLSDETFGKCHESCDCSRQPLEKMCTFVSEPLRSGVEETIKWRGVENKLMIDKESGKIYWNGCEGKIWWSIIGQNHDFVKSDEFPLGYRKHYHVSIAYGNPYNISRIDWCDEDEKNNKIYEIESKYNFTYYGDTDDSKIIELFNNNIIDYDIIDNDVVDDNVDHYEIKHRHKISYLKYIGLYYLLKMNDFINGRKFTQMALYEMEKNQIKNIEKIYGFKFNYEIESIEFINMFHYGKYIEERSEDPKYTYYKALCYLLKYKNEKISKYLFENASMLRYKQQSHKSTCESYVPQFKLGFYECDRSESNRKMIDYFIIAAEKISEEKERCEFKLKKKYYEMMSKKKHYSIKSKNNYKLKSRR